MSTQAVTRTGAGGTGRGAAVFAILALAAAFVLLTGGIVAANQQHAEVRGTATIEPGETLWDVAVAHAPDGTDPRSYLARLRQVNDVDAGALRPWTVVLLPAP